MNGAYGLVMYLYCLVYLSIKNEHVLYPCSIDVLLNQLQVGTTGPEVPFIFKV